MHLSAVLEGLALNPALPQDAVRRLIGHRGGMGEVGKRPDLTDELAGEMIDTGWTRLRWSLAFNEHLPATARLRLARDRDDSVRAATASGCGHGTAREVYELLLADPEEHVRDSLARNDEMPSELRERLAADPSPKVRASLAQHWPGAPEHVRRALLTDAADQVRASACDTYYPRLPHPVHPADLVPALLADPVTRSGAVAQAAVDAETAARLAADPDPQVRAQLARHPQLPAQLRDVLAEDPSAEVRLGVYARQDTPDVVRAAIHAWMLAAPHPMDIDPDLDDEAAELEFMRSVLVAELHMMRLEWVRDDPLPHVGSPYPCFRISAASTRQPLPPEVVARLLADEDREVRLAMARRAPHLVDPATAERLEREYRPFKPTPWRPADVLDFPPDALRRFATDPEPRMRCLAPRDPDLPVDLAVALARDPDAGVRQEIAAHPALPVAVLVALLDDEDEGTVQAAAGSPRLPVEQMHRLLDLAGL
ncbi:hypothetical protein JNUCC0626_09090 [Lentzea sp. JNUCC 0626]|uniref:hypothetical protein n=1 Tax=Lentzea sp. JNUCC 0626 TaxID=3367513 RepID=UPI0037492891